MSKVVREGKVAILYSPGYGAGWFTWNSQHPDMLTDPELVAAVEADDYGAQTEIAERKWPNAYKGGLPLKIEWVPEGARYRVDEYDGSESVTTIDNMTLIA